MDFVCAQQMPTWPRPLEPTPDSASGRGWAVVPAWLSLSVSCDMKLHLILIGWSKILTNPCVSPQVFHGGMRLTGHDWVVITVRGVKPSRQCSKPGSLKPGER